MPRFGSRQETVRLTRIQGSITLHASYSLPFVCISGNSARVGVGTVVNEYEKQNCLVLCGHREELILTSRRRFKGEGEIFTEPAKFEALLQQWYTNCTVVAPCIF